jgi:hypothetical protein
LEEFGMERVTPGEGDPILNLLTGIGKVDSSGALGVEILRGGGIRRTIINL